MSPATGDRPLLLRARPDVVAAAVRVAGSPRWVVTDPVTLAHYDLSDQEYTLLTALGEGACLRELQRAFESRFAPRRISLDEVWEFISRLHHAGLVVATGAGQGAELHQKQAKQRREEVLWSWTRLLAIKLPGLNPDGLLGALYPLVSWAFHWPFLLLAVCVMLFGVSIVVTDYSAFVAGLPGLTELVAPRSLAALLLTAVGVKVLHELGHALACRRFGGQVHEIGVLLLAFTPALYCDVSDMWRLPSKAKRMAVSAAGILVELFLAAVAAIVWRYSDSTVAQMAALNVMIVCTVGTLLVNANPLMRYDGYYLLSDLTETPNLWQRSREALGVLWADWFTRRQRPRPPIRPWWLPVYGLACKAYMVVVLVSILWMLALALRPYRLEALAYLAGAVALAGALAPPIRRLVRWSRNPLAQRRLRRGRAVFGLVLALLLAFGVLQAPIRFSVDGQATIEPRDAELVVTTVEGRLVEAKPAGAVVKRGDAIARLVNPDVALELLELRGRLAEEQLRVRQLDALRARDQQANDQLPAAQAMAADLRRQLASLKDEAARLVLRASRDGVVIRPAELPMQNQGDLTLARWSGTPLDADNLGAWLTTGQEVCRVGDPHQVEARVTLSEDDIERVRVGQRVTLAWNQMPGVVTSGTVVEVSQRVIRTPPNQQRGGSPEPPHYFAQVRFDKPSSGLLLGGAGRARIDTGATTLGELVVTRARQWFRLP